MKQEQRFGSMWCGSIKAILPDGKATELCEIKRIKTAVVESTNELFVIIKSSIVDWYI